METVSKYSLNPLATCFVPSSMKNQIIESTVFPALSYESCFTGPLGTKNLSLPIVGKQETVFDHFDVTKGEQIVVSNPVKETVNEKLVVPAMKVKEILSNTAKEEVSTVGQLTTKVHLTIHERTGKIPNKSDGKKISDRRLKKRTGSKDVSLTEFDNEKPKQQILGKISKFLINGTKITESLLKVWPFAIQSMLVMELFYLMTFNTISLDLTLGANLYSVFKSNRSVTYPKTSKKTKITRNKTKSNECHCPPMFGWIVPFEFFGNPLKLTETCCKDYVHSTYADESSLQPRNSECFMPEDEPSSASDETETLEQCSLELKAVIKDVCDSLSFSYDKGNEESNKTKVSETRKRPVWETVKDVGTKRFTPEVIDDGFHPLLEEKSSVDTDDIDIASIQKFLGEAFSRRKVSHEQETLPSQPVCNPPCSIWCNKVPPSAKDAYKRFIRKLDSESTVQRHLSEAKRTVIKKPLYKRCFSADDTPKSSDYGKTPLLSGAGFESRERLMLLRKDPVAFIKQSSTVASKDSNHKSRSNVSAVFEQVATKDFSDENGCDKWSFYDRADSLWQPLPDCVSPNESAQKHSHKKVRDMRRQKSVC